jgi:hypothetical protein
MPDVGELGANSRTPAPSPEELESLAATASPMTSAEYLTASVLRSLWEDIDAAFRSELAESRHSVQDFLKHKNPAPSPDGKSRAYGDLRERLVELGFRIQPVLKLVPGQEAPMLSAKVGGLGNPVVTLLRTYGCKGWRFMGLLRRRSGLRFAVRFLGSVCVYVSHRRLLISPM